MYSVESLSSRGLGHWVFIPATGVRIPVGMPFFLPKNWQSSESDDYFCLKIGNQAKAMIIFFLEITCHTHQKSSTPLIILNFMLF